MKQVIQGSDNNAVSPIIATIRLIAITIVLAATLYAALTYYASTSSSSKPPVAVSISATLTEKCYVNYTECHSMPYANLLGFANDTTFYELHINSINGCNGNISLKNIQFIISYKNSSTLHKCVISHIPTQVSPSAQPCHTTIASFAGPCGTNFTLTWFHPFRHMISGSIFLFQPYYSSYPSGDEIYSPQNKIYSIEAVNYVNQTILFTANIS